MVSQKLQQTKHRFQKNCSKSKLPYYMDEKIVHIAQFFHPYSRVILILNSFFETG